MGVGGNETSIGGVWETTPACLSRTMALHALQDLTPGEFMDWALKIEEGCGSNSCARAGLTWFPKGESESVDIVCKQVF